MNVIDILSYFFLQIEEFAEGCIDVIEWISKPVSEALPSGLVDAGFAGALIEYLGDPSMISFMLGSGAVMFLSYTLFKWLLEIVR